MRQNSGGVQIACSPPGVVSQRPTRPPFQLGLVPAEVTVEGASKVPRFNHGVIPFDMLFILKVGSQEELALTL